MKYFININKIPMLNVRKAEAAAIECRSVRSYDSNFTTAIAKH